MIEGLSLVPRPSASRARTAYVTFEPLSDNWQKARPGTTPTSFTSKVDAVVKLLDYKYFRVYIDTTKTAT